MNFNNGDGVELHNKHIPGTWLCGMGKVDKENVGLVGILKWWRLERSFLVVRN